MTMRRLTSLAAVLGLLAILAACSVSVNFEPPPPAGYVRVVTASSVNVRSCPSAQCEIRTVAYGGQRVRVFEYEGGWARVNVMDSGVPGWMDARYLAMP